MRAHMGRTRDGNILRIVQANQRRGSIYDAA